MQTSKQQKEPWKKIIAYIGQNITMINGFLNMQSLLFVRGFWSHDAGDVESIGIMLFLIAKKFTVRLINVNKNTVRSRITQLKL